MNSPTTCLAGGFWYNEQGYNMGEYINYQYSLSKILQEYMESNDKEVLKKEKKEVLIDLIELISKKYQEKREKDIRLVD